MYFPGATYRIQFNKSFTFKDLAQIIPYLDTLGVKTIYAAPVFDAMPGSVHGYDGTDPNKINPWIGTYEELKEIAAALKKRNMGWIQDFVPNHMAYSIKNQWLRDLFEKGTMSLYDHFFDTNPEEPVMAPFLDTSLENAVEQDMIRLGHDADGLNILFSETALPVNSIAYKHFLNEKLFNASDIRPLQTELETILNTADKLLFRDKWASFREQFMQLISKKKLEQISKDKTFIRKILDMQYYRLCDWRETDHIINYRRFFTINGLICVNIQRQEVFDAYHKLLEQLVKEGIFQGVRIDHIDGLYDPGTYLQRLRNLLGEDTYIVVEKILGDRETIPEHWPVQGTTGYDFMAQVNNVLINKEGNDTLTKFYHFIATHENLSGIIETYKSRFLHKHMEGELNKLADLFHSIIKAVPSKPDDGAIKALIAELLVCCPVYRYYIDALPFNEVNKAAIDALIDRISSRGHVKKQVIDFFRLHFIDVRLPDNDEAKGRILHFWRRCMQFSGPLMAKGIEDTLFYNYNALIANNEVGNSIAPAILTPEQFHEIMEKKAATFPWSMNATATHDTKRGEDSRARLQYLSLITEDWLQEAGKWLADVDDHGLSKEERYFVLQAIYSSLDLKEDTGAYQARFKDFIIKAARESGRVSTWHEPDEAHEQNLLDYAMSFIHKKNQAGQEMRAFINRHNEPMAAQALKQLVLKCTCPGIPDIYQGTELWDFSFVDPDNRRAVDYSSATGILQAIMASGMDIQTLKQGITTPAVKLYVLHKLLALRRQHEALFAKGSYEPLHIAPQLLSFTRSHNNKRLIVVLPEDISVLSDEGLKIPSNISGNFRNVLTGEQIEINEQNIREQLRQFPALVLIGTLSPDERKSGILAPLFSLPSEFGIGGMGREAYKFLSMLAAGGQKIWQLLPLNPVLKENDYSPYACVSAFAGDPMYIDPLLLLEEGLIDARDIAALKSAPERKVAYGKVKKAKAEMLHKAWASFRKDADPAFKKAFIQFCKDEKEWLDDYTLFTVIRENHQYKPWFEWPKPLRDRDAQALEAVKHAHKDALELEQWMQFLFHRQWNHIKKAAHEQGISLIGDIPFYLSHNSCDVWANRELFSLDKNGKMLQSGGVPPDYFSAQGQLWLMPTYNWQAAKETDFDWWLKRLKQNVRLFDIIRLDHFRAFYDYWEVPATNKDAIDGKWMEGPRDGLFRLILEHFPDMPFLAEDLGEIHAGVFTFKDKYKLKGMRILQFGFDPFDGKLRDLPHNFEINTVAYTGTHDNDTITGWFGRLNKRSRKALKEYAGHKVNKKKVHDTLIKMAYGSVAVWAIIPLQDILKLDESARLNTPATTENNWLWRLLPKEFTEKHVQKLKALTALYNR